MNRFLIALSLIAVPALAHAADFTDQYDVDGSHTSIVFKVSHNGLSHSFGMFSDVKGTLAYDEKDAKANAIEVNVAAASINTMNSARDEHLRAPDYFNAEEHKNIGFKSSEWVKKGDGEYEVKGELTLLGTTKPITVAVKALGSGENHKGDLVRGFETTFVVKRSEFGMEKNVGPIGDEVEITVSLEAVLKKIEAPAQL